MTHQCLHVQFPVPRGEDVSSLVHAHALQHGHENGHVHNAPHTGDCDPISLAKPPLFPREVTDSAAGLKKMVRPSTSTNLARWLHVDNMASSAQVGRIH